MGTDIALRWDEDTPEEKEFQCTRFSIYAGRQGYARVSFKKTIETSVLREVFALMIHAFKAAMDDACQKRHQHYPEDNP